MTALPTRCAGGTWLNSVWPGIDEAALRPVIAQLETCDGAVNTRAAAAPGSPMRNVVHAARVYCAGAGVVFALHRALTRRISSTKPPAQQQQSCAAKAAAAPMRLKVMPFMLGSLKLGTGRAEHVNQALCALDLSDEQQLLRVHDHLLQWQTTMAGAEATANDGIKLTKQVHQAIRAAVAAPA